MVPTPSYILRLTRAAFRQEAEELLAELDTSLLRLEAAPGDRSHVDRVFRAMHTLKGSGATAGFHEVSRVLHDVEDIFNGAREGKILITSAIVDHVLPIMDLIKQMLTAGDAEMPPLVTEGARLVEALKRVGPRLEPGQPADPVRPAETVERGSEVCAIRFCPHAGFFRTGNDPLVYLKELLQYGPGVVRADTQALEATADFNPEESYLSWQLQLASEASPDTLRNVFAFVEDDADIEQKTVASTEGWVLPPSAYFEKQMLADFLEECADDVAEIESLVLALEEGSDRAARLVELRRHLHNLKGIARLLLAGAHRTPPPGHPLRGLGDLCHAAEDALSREDWGENPDNDEYQVLLDLVDWMRDLAPALLSGGTDRWPSELLEQLKAGTSRPETRDNPANITESVVLEVARQYHDVVSAIVKEQSDETVAPPEEIQILCRAFRTLGSAADFEGADALSKQIATATSACAEEAGHPRWAEVREHLRGIETQLAAFRDRPLVPSVSPLSPRSTARPHGRTVSLRPTSGSCAPKRSGAPSRGPTSPSRGPASPAQAGANQGQVADLTRSIRVEQSKLDRLMQAISELLIAKNALPVLAQKVETRDTSTVGREIKDLGIRIAHIADDLQDAMRQVRMLPIRTVFQKFPRMIRDLARSLGKQIQLIMAGEETELDKTVLEQIGDPLVHLIRNAVDHGIESPEERQRHTKPEMGTIGLEVLAEGAHIVIRVSDDGRGMDPVRLRAKAVEKGLLGSAAAEVLSDQQALELVFLAGFSTAETVTSVSGRGVGMDVVQNSVRSLRGTIAISSALGSGTVFTIRLPSSVMVSKGVLVEADGEQYVLPIEGVREMVKLRGSDIRTYRDQAMVMIRGEVSRVVSMAQLLGRQDEGGTTCGSEEANALLVTTETGTLAVVVDRLVAEIDVIAKPLAEGYDAKRVFRGATILGDGRVALVLEPARFDRLLSNGSMRLCDAGASAQ